MISTLSFLNSMCTLQRKNQTLATNYEQTGTWSNTVNTLPCAIQALRVFEMTQASRESGVQEFDVYFAPGTNIQNGDALTNFSGMTGLGTTDLIEVISAQADDGGENAYVRVLCRQVKGSEAR